MVDRAATMRRQAISWIANAKLTHAQDGTIRMLGNSGAAVRVAMIVDENANPRKPPDSAKLSRPITLELYFPLPPGTDRVRKCLTVPAAQELAASLLYNFVLSALSAREPQQGEKSSHGT